jgi:hypothetical protein
MPRRTNKDRIIDTLLQFPGLDDDELSRLSGVQPRQQVNMICRELQKKGILYREEGRTGKITNYVHGTSNKTLPSASSSLRSSPLVRHVPKSPIPQRKPEKAEITASSLSVGSLRSTLIILPCSGAKAEDSGRTENGISILDTISPNLADRLRDARKSIASQAGIEEKSLLPAWQRYSGSLYMAAHNTFAELFSTNEENHILIISGGYGLLLANEPIGDYNAIFKAGQWPDGLLEDILINYVENNHLNSIRAFASSTTDYRKLIDKVPWTDIDLKDGWRISPEPVRGAMKKTPRAQGEALSALLKGNLHQDWASSDGLRLQYINLI